MHFRHAFIISILLLAACGGGGGGSASPVVANPTPANTPTTPTVTIGTVSVTAFSVSNASGTPHVITAGANGDLWFTEMANAMGHITTQGVFSEFPLPAQAWTPTLGPDGAIWYTELPFPLNKIGRMTTSGIVTEYGGLTAQSAPLSIVAGPDGALWFTEQNVSQIGRITTAGMLTEFHATAGVMPNDIVVGTDGALWYSELSGGIGRMTTSGTNVDFVDPNETRENVQSIAVDASGNKWFTSTATAGDAVGELSGAGLYHDYRLSATDSTEPRRIVVTPDGNVWFLLSNPTTLGQPTLGLGRMSPSGTLTEFNLLTNSSIDDLALGPDGALWLTDPFNRTIDRVDIAHATP